MRTDAGLARWQRGRAPDAARLRVYLTGELSLEAGDRLVHERQLPGPLARHAFAFLAAEHSRAVGHDEIAEEIWDGSPPEAWGTSLKALVSRTRSALTAGGLDGAALLVGAPGVYRFCLPAGGWVDIDAAQAAIHAAEAALNQGDLVTAAQEAFVAKLTAARPLLPGFTGSWLERRRVSLADLRVRTLESSTRIHLARGAVDEAARDAQRAVEVAPLREPSWRLLMDSYAAAGDIASAIHAYGRCRAVLIEALGIGPSLATRERHAALLARAG